MTTGLKALSPAISTTTQLAQAEPSRVQKPFNGLLVTKFNPKRSDGAQPDTLGVDKKLAWDTTKEWRLSLCGLTDKKIRVSGSLKYLTQQDNRLLFRKDKPSAPANQKLATRDHKVFLMPKLSEVKGSFFNMHVEESGVSILSELTSKGEMTFTIKGIKVSGSHKRTALKFSDTHEKILKLKPCGKTADGDGYKFNAHLTEKEIQQVKNQLSNSKANFLRLSVRGSKN